MKKYVLFLKINVIIRQKNSMLQYMYCCSLLNINIISKLHKDIKVFYAFNFPNMNFNEIC